VSVFYECFSVLPLYVTGSLPPVKTPLASSELSFSLFPHGTHTEPPYRDDRSSFFCPSLERSQLHSFDEPLQDEI